MNEDLLVSEGSKQQPSYSYYSAYPNIEEAPIVLPPKTATPAPEVVSSRAPEEEAVLAELKRPQEHPQF